MISWAQGQLMDQHVNKTIGISIISWAQGKLMDQHVNKTTGISMISWAQGKLMDQHVNRTIGISMISWAQGKLMDQNVYKTKEISMILVCSIEPNRDLVLRDQKVPPEIPNRPFLQREYFSHLTFRNYFLIQSGNLRFPDSTSDILITPSWSLRRVRDRRLVCFELHFRFRNLWFQHRGA